jgi:hypothetical protein
MNFKWPSRDRHGTRLDGEPVAFLPRMLFKPRASVGIALRLRRGHAAENATQAMQGKDFSETKTDAP